MMLFEILEIVMKALVELGCVMVLIFIIIAIVARFSLESLCEIKCRKMYQKYIESLDKKDEERRRIEREKSRENLIKFLKSPNPFDSLTDPSKNSDKK